MTTSAYLSGFLADPAPDGGRFGRFGGRYVPETLVPALERLGATASELFVDPGFRQALTTELRDFVGRPTALTLAAHLSEKFGAEIWLKREDLCHTGAHKINNAIAQALLARRLDAKRIVAETGAGQHGVATAAAAARVGLPCRVYMGAADVVRQRPNVERMRLLGAQVVEVNVADKTLRAAINEAMRDWVSDPNGTYYLLGSAVGPHPYPWMVRSFQAVIGLEARHQFQEVAGGLPDVVVACVGGGSNAIGIFHPFRDDVGVKLLGVEAGGKDQTHSATLNRGTPGVLHGAYSQLLQTPEGQVVDTHSLAPGLDYPGVGPEHSHLKDIGRAEYMVVDDREALEALVECSKAEGILPALESSHALAGAKRWAMENPGSRIVVCLSGRGDKDLDLIMGSESR